MRHASDEELALSTKDGDRAAFDELVRRHQGRVYAVAYRITWDREEALDVAQEAFVKAYRKIGRWQPSGAFGAWLMRLATNQAIDHARRLKRHRERRVEGVAPEEADEAYVASESGRAERRVRGFEIEDRVQAALTKLSPSQRTAFVLRHYEGMALADIAPVLGCSVGSVKVHLFRALRKLRVELHDLNSE